MDTNTQHQRWSLWTYKVYPDTLHRPDFATVKFNAAKFAGLMFGMATEMSVRQLFDGRLCWEIKVLTEGHPVHDPVFVERAHAHWKAKFFEPGFGQTCEVHSSAKLQAGDRQDGRPADQLIILPPLTPFNSVSE